MTIRLLLSIATRNVRRNLRRSLLTATSILLCVALLIFGISWLNGILFTIVSEFVSISGTVQITTTQYAAKSRLMPLHLSIPQAARIEGELRQAGFEAVYPRITFGGLLIRGEEDNAPGVGRAVLRQDAADNLDLEDRLYSGRLLDDDADEIVLGRLLADELAVSVGDEVTFLGTGATESIAAWNFEVVGLFDAGSGMVNRTFYVPLSVAQEVLDLSDQATSLALFAPDLLYRRELPAPLIEVMERHPDLEARHWLSPGGFGAVFGIMKYIIGTVAAIVMFVASLGVLNTMMMSVMERKRELGVLLAQGTPPIMVLLMLLLEAATLGLMGSSVGAGLGAALSLLLERTGIDLGEATTRSLPVPVNDVIHADVTPTIVLAGFAMGLIVSLAGALLPAWRALHIEPADALRIEA